MKGINPSTGVITGRPFPGLLGRGLIEGSRDSGRRRGLGSLSPVYWAGASLKG